MNKKYKTIKNTINNKSILLFLAISSPIQSMASGVVDEAFGTTGYTHNVIKAMILNSVLISTLLQSSIIVGILFSIFQIGKELLGEGGQGGKALWSKIGAMIAFAILYYYLFMGNSYSYTPGFSSSAGM